MTEYVAQSRMNGIQPIQDRWDTDKSKHDECDVERSTIKMNVLRTV